MSWLGFYDFCFRFCLAAAAAAAVDGWRGDEENAEMAVVRFLFFC